MNELLQKHGCSAVFIIPEGLKELSSDITREVLRWQPVKLLDFIANYLSALLITREHGIMAVKILEDLCDCRPTVSEHLLEIGLDRPQANRLATIIKEEVEKDQAAEGKEKVKEMAILKKILKTYPLDEEMSVKVCQVARNAYRDYWYRKNLLEKGLKTTPDEAWEKAAEHTLDLYKRTRPSLSELRRATEKIQAAYRGYHIRRNVLKHLMPVKKKKKPSRKVELPGPPLDIATSREIYLGPIIKIQVKEDDVVSLFDAEAGEKIGLKYDPMKTITHEDDEFLKNKKAELAMKAPQVSVMEMTLSKPSFDVSAVSDYDKTKATPIPGRFQSHQRISFSEGPPMIIKTPEILIEGVGVSCTKCSVEVLEPPAAFEVVDTTEHSNVASAHSGAASAHSGAASAHAAGVASAYYNVTSAHSNLALTHSGVALTQSNIASAPSNVASAHSNVASAHSGVALAHSNVASAHSGVVLAHSNVASAHSGVALAHSDVASADTSVGSAHSSVGSAHSDEDGD